jgi:hypothetical protein
MVEAGPDGWTVSEHWHIGNHHQNKKARDGEVPGFRILALGFERFR